MSTPRASDQAFTRRYGWTLTAVSVLLVIAMVLTAAPVLAADGDAFIEEFSTSHDDTPRGVDQLDDGTVVTINSSGYTHGWDPDDGSLLWVHDELGQVGWDVIATSDGLVVSSGNNGAIVAWDPDTETVEWTHDEHSSHVRTVIETDAGLIASAGDEGTVLGWNPDTETVEWSHTEHTDAFAVYEAANGNIISGGLDGDVVVYDPGTDSVVSSHSEHPDGSNVRAVAEAPDGTVVSVGGGEVIGWDPVENSVEWSHTEHSGTSGWGVGVDDDGIVYSMMGDTIGYDPATESVVFEDRGGTHLTVRDGNRLFMGQSSSDEARIVYKTGVAFSNADPDSTTESEPTELSVDVSLDEWKGETEITFSDSEGDVIGTDSLSDDGTATTTWDWTHEHVDDSGDLRWSVEIGGAESDTYVFTPESSNPQLSNASPEDESDVTETPVELAIDLEDADFDEDRGDEVTLEWFLNDESYDTTTHTQNETATITIDSDDLETGENTWYVTAEDGYSNTDRAPDSGTYTFNTPDTLEIYNESAPDTLVDGDVEVTLRFYREGEDEVIERSTSDGTVSMEGLPPDDEFLVTAEADGYVDRRILIRSLFDQQEVFLLPEEEETATIIFQLDDDTGDFPATETRLFIDRALNRSGETRYRTIVSDHFDSTQELPIELEDDVRYRLRIENEEGQVRSLGSYTTTGDDTARLPIGNVRIGVDEEDSGIAFGAEIHQHDDGQRFVRVEYLDPDGLSSNLEITIVHLNGTEEETVTTDLITDPGTRSLGTYDLPVEHDEDATYRVEYQVDRNGETLEGERLVGAVQEIADRLGVQEDVLMLIGFVTILAVTGLLAVVSPAMAGIAGVAIAAFTTAIGVTPIPGVGIAFAGGIALLYALARTKGVR